MSPAETGAAVPGHVPPELISEGPVPGQAHGSNPYMQLADLHDGPRAIFKPPIGRYARGGWVLSRIDDIREVLQNTEVFSNQGEANFAEYVGETWPAIPIALDPPEHGKYRAFLNRAFSPQRMKSMEAGVR